MGVSILTSATIITGALLNSIKVDAVSTSAQATVNVEEACTMNSTITTPHTATIPNGTYQADIGTTTINVICNDSQGYAIYAVGYTGDEIGGENSTKLVNATGNANTIATGTATSGNTSNWAMKISTSGSSFVGTIDNSFGNYHAVPNEYTKVAHYNSATDAGTGATGSTYQTTYAAFVSSTQLAGNYAGKVKYTMVHPANEFVPHEVACQANRICYNPNTAIVEGQMGREIANNNSSVVLYAPNFKKQGYGFAGWSDAYDYGTNPNANIYGPQETITTPSDMSVNGLSLYAIWVKSEGSMQTDVSSVCNDLTQSGPNVTKTLNSVSALTDERDGNTYAIAKLADGNCWMIENLRLDDSPTLSSNNTHNPSLPLTNVYDTNITSNHLSPTSLVSYDATTTPEGWCSTTSSACIDQSRIRTDNTVLFASNVATNYNEKGNVYAYGNYYNWYSATGGHGKYGWDYGNGYHAPGDICPAGWHLPAGGSSSAEMGVLDVNIGGTGTSQYTSEASIRWRVYPNNYTLSGDMSSSSISNRNYGTSMWTSTGYTNYAANYFHLVTGAAVPGTDATITYFGLIVRCIAGT